MGRTVSCLLGLVTCHGDAIMYASGVEEELYLSAKAEDTLKRGCSNQTASHIPRASEALPFSTCSGNAHLSLC